MTRAGAKKAMAKENDDEAPAWLKKQIKEAVDILRSDGMHIHKTYADFQKSLGEEKETPPKDGDPPPAKDEPTEKPVKKGMWWGARLEGDEE
jgi:hypothetical protein